MEKKKVSLELMLSLFTMRVYFHEGYDAFPAHSWRNEVRIHRRGRPDQFKLIDHEWAYKSLIKLAEQGWKGKFKNAIIYHNHSKHELYWNCNDHVQHNPKLNYVEDAKHNKLLHSFEFRVWNEEAGANETKVCIVNDKDLKDHAIKNWQNRKYLENRCAFDCPLIQQQRNQPQPETVNAEWEGSSNNVSRTMKPNTGFMRLGDVVDQLYRS